MAMKGGLDSSMHSLAPLDEDSERRMSCSDPEMRHAQAQHVGLTQHDVAAALQNVEELFPAEGIGDAGSLSRTSSAVKDPLSRHNALGRRRVDSTARPQEFFTWSAVNEFREDHFDERSFHGHHINAVALRERLDSKALDWSIVGRVQNDFATHDKLSADELESLNAKVDRAQNLHRTNSLKDAEKLYEDVLESNPLDWDCLSNLAKIAFAAGHYGKAKELFERAVAIRPERDKTVYYLGHVLFKLRALDRAEAIFRQVADNYKKGTRDESTDASTYQDAMAMLGLCLQSSGNLTAARSVYDQVLSENSKHVQTLCHLCALKSKMGLAAEAARDHVKVVGMEPSHTRRVCPYLDTLFPSDSEMLHEMQNLNERIEKAPAGKVPSKSMFRTMVRKFMRVLKRKQGKQGRDREPGAGASSTSATSGMMWAALPRAAAATVAATAAAGARAGSSAVEAFGELA